MKIAHATDIHWTTDVPWSRLPGKRLLGTANQYLRGRRRHFPRKIQQTLIQHILSLAPDLFILTGDLTAQALPEEFEMAREDLEPILQRIPTVVLPGNHDLYTSGAQKEDRIAEYFGEYLHRDRHLGVFQKDNITVLTLDPNRPTFLDAAGEVPQAQLEQLREQLMSRQLEGQFILLALHYPILDRAGEVYDNGHHGLLNAKALIKVLEESSNHPSLILHGHEHHGFMVQLPLGERQATLIDCGSSGYAYMPDKKRAAAMAVYDVQGSTFTIERYLYDGGAFSLEEGGAFSSGR